MDSVFIFQNSAEKNENTSYDAIVVEQWTVVDVGLFNSLENISKLINTLWLKQMKLSCVHAPVAECQFA